MLRIGLVCTGLLLSVLTLSSQVGTLTGQVTDRETDQPVSFAQILLDSARFETMSDAYGRFQFTGLPAGPHRVLVSRIGYRAVDTLQVVLTPGDTFHLQVALQPISIFSGEIVVTAARKTQSIHLAPASASVVTRDLLARRPVTTFDQALDYVPGVTVSRSSGSNVQSLSIRGASETAGGGTGNRVLLLIDGRPSLSPESGGALWNLVPLNSLERIEVVKGAYSALFGSSAMGGVVHAITRQPSEEPDTRVDLSYGFYDRSPAFQESLPDGHRHFYGLGLSQSRKLGKWSYLIDLARKFNSGHREKSSFTLNNVFGKVNYDFTPNRQLSVTANLNTLFNDTPATWLSTQMPLSVAEHRKDDTQDKNERSVDVHYRAITHSEVQYASRFYYYHNGSVFNFNDDPANDSTNVNIGKQFVDRSTIRTRRWGNVSQVDAVLGDHYAILGVDVKLDRTVALPDTVLYGRHDAFEFGAYVQDEWSPSDRLTITGGVRFDYYAIDDAFSEINWSPKIAAVYAWSPSISVRGLLARAFRNPSIAERFIKFEQGGGLIFDPNPDLVSEKLHFSAETGINIKQGDALSFDLALYHNRYRDLISFIQVSAPLEPLVFRVINLKKAVMQGVDLELTYRPVSWLSARATYSFLDARDISAGRFNDELAYKPRHTYSLSTEATVGRASLAVTGRGRSRIEEVFIYPDSKPDGYILWNLRTTFQIADDISVYISANNVFNTQYEELERYRMPGRNFSTGLRARL
ncbi:MAG: TonB-dependent receptor [Saprospiraceae bacterium]|nr:TonB-dependent receptor [Saprospiraceae bacterium]